MARRKISARLDVLLAPKARKAVVLRRGPAKLVCSVGWNLANDTFELGQWIKGRIHAFCCDLSPDGKYFIYYVMKGHNFQGDYDWTAISRTPYLKAISRWKQSAGLPGGGLFLTENRYWLNNGWSAYQECNEVVQEPHYPGDEFTFDCRNVYIRRQLRDGWKLVNKVGDTVGLELLTFEKSLNKKWVIRNKFDNPDIGLQRGACPSDYQLSNFVTGEVQLHPTWEWADVDGGRLLWAEDGKIFSADIEAQGLGPAKVLYDFNDMTFQKIEAPY